MTKKIMALILSALMLFSLAACSSAQKGENPPSQEVSQTPLPEEVAPTEETSKPEEAAPAEEVSEPTEVQGPSEEPSAVEENEPEQEPAIEFHWNTPVQVSSSITVSFFTEGENYGVEITHEELESSTLRMGLKDNPTASEMLGFDYEGWYDWYLHIVDIANDGWEDGRITYASAEGYGRKWVAYASTDDNAPGIIGMKVNNESELETACGIDVLE